MDRLGYCVDYLVWRQRVDGDGDVGGAVERETALIADGEVGLVGEDGADVLCAAASGECGGQFDFKMNQEGAGPGEEQGAGGCVLDCAAAKSEDEGVRGGEAGDGFMLADAEGRFAVAGEELGNSCAGFGLDYVVKVDEGPAEALGEERANGSFAGAHEAGQDDAAVLGWLRIGLGFVQGFGLGWAGHSSVFAVLSFVPV
jgi:hypothetical protein